uniref:Uncharacterized protein n=1 Tax=Wuchereria bancrofti TaxID=6293 RepID=A0A1I8E8M8_WUCBA
MVTTTVKIQLGKDLWQVCAVEFGCQNGATWLIAASVLQKHICGRQEASKKQESKLSDLASKERLLQEGASVPFSYWH